MKKKITLGGLLIPLVFIMIVGKIYQHNKVIRYSYKKQRLEASCKSLLREYDALMIQLAELTDYRSVQAFAQKELAMERVALSRVVTVTWQIGLCDGKQI
jgi:cell division protein FtsL